MDISPEEKEQARKELAERFRNEDGAPTELTKKVEGKIRSALELAQEKKPENFSASLELKILLYKSLQIEFIKEARGGDSKILKFQSEVISRMFNDNEEEWEPVLQKIVGQVLELNSKEASQLMADKFYENFVK